MRALYIGLINPWRSLCVPAPSSPHCSPHSWSPAPRLSRRRPSVPPPPAGWTTVWSDDFNGANGTLPSGANWIIDTGHGYPGGPGNWGTGEIQNYTEQPDNLALDGTGNLRITPRRDGAGNWTSARIETQRTTSSRRPAACCAIEGRIQMPNVTGNAALGYWPAFWALGAPYRGNYWNWPGIGEFDIMENVNGINSVWGVLHCGVNPGGPCNETTGIGANRACPGSTCQSALPHLPLRVGHAASRRTSCAGTSTDSSSTRVSQGQVPADTWTNMTVARRVLRPAERRHRRRVPGRARRSDAARRDRARSPDGRRLRGRVHAAAAARLPRRPLPRPAVAAARTAPSRPSRSSSSPARAPRRPPTPAAARTSCRSATATGPSTTASTSAAAPRHSSSPGSPPVRPAESAAWSRYASTAAPTPRSAASPSPTPAAGSPGARSPPTSARVTGTHDVYLTFTSGQPADFVNLNWFTFGH